MAEIPEMPRLRAVEAFPATVDGREMICLRDPSGLSEAVVSISREAAAILALFDGTRTLLDVQAEVMRRHGELVPRSELEALLGALDERLFLESERLSRERRRLAAEFREAPARRAAHAGRAYADRAEELGRALDGFFAHPEGPGPGGQAERQPLQGLIAPHIDFARGGPAYAWAYGRLAEAAAADCFVVLGTAHGGLDGQPFAVTRKAYETPFGALAVDDEVLAALTRRAPGDLLAAELAHRTEHSVEFQAVCLQYLHRWRRDPAREVRIVPILASFAHECLAVGIDPMARPEVAGVLDALRAAMATVPRRYCLVAGADLAHVGPRFGDPEPVDRAGLASIEAEDRALLGLVAGGDADGLFAAVAREGDRRRICGLSPIYALLRALPSPAEGRLLRYGQSPDPFGVVTFASLAFEEPAGGGGRG